MEDWDLQAVVRGCGGATATATQARTDDPLSCWTPLPEDNKDFVFCFPNLVEEEEDDLWKPFFLKPESQQPQRSTPNPSCSTSVSFLKPKQPLRSLSSQTTRSKRRKKQQKKVVCQVPTNGLSSDMWAWRKYGQKPIKGSPFPRGYYKCSSSKECSARKQVERSRTDPGLYTIIYTGEHNHPVPTHRNSLAGSTRQKFPASAGMSPSSSVSEAEKVVEEEALMVSDMEVLGEDEMVILGFEEGSPEWFAGGGW